MSRTDHPKRKTWPGLKALADLHRRSKRARDKQLLRAGQDERIDARHRHSAKWDIW